MKGWHPVSDWPLTFSQLSYRYGFIRRGLPGTLYSFAGVHRQAGLVWAFTLQFALLLVAIGLLCRQVRPGRQPSTYVTIALFAGSPVVTMLAFLRGYTDLPLALVTVLLLLVRSPGLRFAVGLIAVPALVLSHEASILWLLPVILLSFTLDALQGKTCVTTTFCYVLALSVLAGTLTAVTSFHQNMTGRQVRAMRMDMLTRTDIPLSLEPLYVLARNFTDNHKMVVSMHDNSTWRRRALRFALELLPTCVLLLHALRRAVRALLAERPQPVRLGMQAVFTLTAAAPLLLHLLGWDASRFNALEVLVLFLIYLLACRSLPDQALPLSAAERNVTCLVIAFNLFTTVHSV